MSRLKNLIGIRFDRLLVNKLAYIKNGTAYWECVCDCGSIAIVNRNNLTSSGTKSCGCLKSELQTAFRNKNFKDMLGMKMGRLLVTKQSDKRLIGAVCWECVCDCGNKCIVSGVNLRTGNTTSCGCYNLEKIKESNTLSSDEAVVYHKYSGYKYRAERKGWVFELTIPQFSALLLSDCHYCGIKPQPFVLRTHSLDINGIDRKNSDIGYTIDNCVPCCADCNFLKRDIPYNNFISVIKQISNNLATKEV